MVLRFDSFLLDPREEKMAVRHRSQWQIDVDTKHRDDSKNLRTEREIFECERRKRRDALNTTENGSISSRLLPTP